jgi:hypothetical protein
MRWQQAWLIGLMMVLPAAASAGEPGSAGALFLVISGRRRPRTPHANAADHCRRRHRRFWRVRLGV